jgi:hypothetical protein
MPQFHTPYFRPPPSGPRFPFVSCEKWRYLSAYIFEGSLAASGVIISKSGGKMVALRGQLEHLARYDLWASAKLTAWSHGDAAKDLVFTM